jgi:hypothetical protein
VGEVDFKVISASENSNNSEKSQVLGWIIGLNTWGQPHRPHLLVWYFSLFYISSEMSKVTCHAHNPPRVKGILSLIWFAIQLTKCMLNTSNREIWKCS